MFHTAVKILVVDDMLTIRKIAKKILNELHFKNIHEAADGSEAWQIINKEGSFDLIISDWNMPKMSGLELLQKVRSTPSIAYTPFILLTAEADLNQVKQAVEAGVDNYVLKPFTSDILKSKLEQTHQKLLKQTA
jgi:two-component system, chemotaxis family, chemotaxis protein CheY